jgi:hypothetical protein
MNRACALLMALALGLILSARTVRAQVHETVGTRAQGMGGAFTAVADDATATWWNPAGLAAGAYFNLILETGSRQEPADDRAVPGWRVASRGFAVAYPALGLSYYRLRISEIESAGSTASDSASRQDQGAAPVRIRLRVLNQFGATVGQSIGAHLVVASTVKLIRAGAAADARDRATTSLDTAADLNPQAEMHAGLDLGAMAKFRMLTLGLMVRNIKESTFGDGDGAFTLTRHVRAGIAVGSAGARGATQITVAADADLSRTDGVLGEERRFGAGAEVWTLSRRLGVRGGIGGNLIDRVRPAPSGGLSVAIRPSTYVDAHVTWGSDEVRRGWGAAFRVTF